MESWRRLEEEGLEHYEISDRGNWRDYETKQEPKEIYRWKDKGGYNRVTLYRKGNGGLQNKEKRFLSKQD